MGKKIYSALFSFYFAFACTIVYGQCNLALETNPALSGTPSNCNPATFKCGSGAYYDLAITANTYYNFSWANGAGGNINGFCANPQNGTGSGGLFTTNQTCWYSGSTTILRVSANRSSATWNATSGTMTYRHADPSTPSITNSNPAICSGGSSTLSISPAMSCGVGYWQNTTSGGTATTAQSPQSVSTAGTFYYRGYSGGTNGCWGTEASAAVTVSSDPSAPTLLVATPANASSVCAGFDLYATFNAGSNGLSCADEFQYIVSGAGPVGGTFAYSPGNAINTSSMAGRTVTMQGRRLCSGDGCDGPAETFATLATWTIVADPTAPTLNVATPLSGTTVCEGQNLSATFNAGFGGLSCSDQFQYVISGAGPIGGTFTYTGGNIISTIGLGGRTVTMQTRRDCSGNGCDGAAETFATVATWTVVPDPSVSIAVTSSPMCATSNVGTITATPSNGTGAATYTWEWSLDGSTGWTSAGAGTTSGGGTIITTPSLNAKRFYRCNVFFDGLSCNLSPFSNVVSIDIPSGPSVVSDSVTNCGPYVLTASPGLDGNTCRFYNNVPPVVGGSGIILATGSGVTVSNTQNIYITSYNTTTQCESFVYQIVNVTITPTFTVTPSNPNNSLI